LSWLLTLAPPSRTLLLTRLLLFLSCSVLIFLSDSPRLGQCEIELARLSPRHHRPMPADPNISLLSLLLSNRGCAYAYAQDDKEVIDITSW
jgi:hypothetical protein